MGKFHPVEAKQWVFTFSVNLPRGAKTVYPKSFITWLAGHTILDKLIRYYFLSKYFTEKKDRKHIIIQHRREREIKLLANLCIDR